MENQQPPEKLEVQTVDNQFNLHFKFLEPLPRLEGVCFANTSLEPTTVMPSGLPRAFQVGGSHRQVAQFLVVR